MATHSFKDVDEVRKAIKERDEKRGKSENRKGADRGSLKLEKKERE